MADQLNNTNQPQGGQVPPPPSTGSVDIRTQGSDINSIKQSGGASPQPQQFNLGANNNAPQAPAPQQGGEPPANLPTAPQQGGGEPVFDPNQAPKGSSKKVDIKKLSLIGIAVLVLIILAWVGYAYVYPIFFPSNVVPPVVVNENQNNVIPPAGENIDNNTTNENQTNVEAETVAPINLIDLTGASGSYGANLETLSNDLVNIAGLSVFSQENNFNELILTNFKNERASFSDFLVSVLELDQALAESLFTSDMSAFLYYDENENLSVGYVGKIKEDASLTAARDFIKDIETSENLINIFTSNSLEKNGTFKDGQVNSLPARYLLFSNNKALDYFWSGNHIVITTSYEAAQFIEPKLIN